MALIKLVPSALTGTCEGGRNLLTSDIMMRLQSYVTTLTFLAATHHPLRKGKGGEVGLGQLTFIKFLLLGMC